MVPLPSPPFLILLPTMVGQGKKCLKIGPLQRSLNLNKLVSKYFTPQQKHANNFHNLPLPPYPLPPTPYPPPTPPHPTPSHRTNSHFRYDCSLSGHKSVNSVQNYARRLTASRKRNISASFAIHLSMSSDSGAFENLMSPW